MGNTVLIMAQVPSRGKGACVGSQILKDVRQWKYLHQFQVTRFVPTQQNRSI